MAIITHDQIYVPADKGLAADAGGEGVLSKAGVLWGNNALQSVTITRNTPQNPQQAIGHLGTVDYTTGTITSEVALDAVIVEGCDKADSSDSKTNSIYRFANEGMILGVESYVLTSFSSAFTAGSPATLNLGYLTATKASAIQMQAQPDSVEQGEESSYAVVMGDDGSGIVLVPVFDGAASPVTSDTLPIMSTIDALNPTYISDQGLPVGVQSLNFSGNINRDNVLDVRTAQPVQFVTTYPLDMSCDMEIFSPPVDSSGIALWDYLQSISIQASDLSKHPSGGETPVASSGDNYIRAIGFRKVSERESVAVGQFLTFSVSFQLADLVLPLAAPSA